MIDLRHSIRFFALDAASAALRAEGLDACLDAAKAYLAEHPELLRDAELTLRASPVVRQMAKRWREEAAAGADAGSGAATFRQDWRSPSTNRQLRLFVLGLD